jgi:demethylmenaquinone methyltransferase/2-methoxy-6-polyprenyl-1,4-benzoquinol methylase
MDPNARAAANRQFFNERATGWSERCWGEKLRAGGIEAKLERLFAAVAIPAAHQILDIGAGDGFLVPFLLPCLAPDAILTEVDVADQMIAENRKRHTDPRLRFLVADASSMETTERYDAILAFSCFPHFADHAGTIRHLNGLLAPGGRLAVCHLQSSEEMNRFHRGAHPDVSNHELPAAVALSRLVVDAGLAATATVDEPGFYLVVGQRPASN